MRHVIDGASLLIQKPDTSISFYFPFSVISQFGKLSRGLSKSSVLFYVIIFWASLVGRWFIAPKFRKKVDFVSNVVVYSFLS